MVPIYEIANLDRYYRLPSHTIVYIMFRKTLINKYDSDQNTFTQKLVDQLKP